MHANRSERMDHISVEAALSRDAAEDWNAALNICQGAFYVRPGTFRKKGYEWPKTRGVR